MSAARSRVAAVVAGSLVVVGIGATGAVARDFVTSGEIDNQTIRSQDIHRGGVGTNELHDGAVESDKLKNGDVRKRDLSGWVQNRLERQSLDGADGQDGADGEDGEDGVSGYEVIGRGEDSLVADGTMQTIEADCVPGKTAMSGGLHSSSPADVTIHGSYPWSITEVTDPQDRPDSDPNGIWHATSWQIDFTATAGTSVQAYVICTDVAEFDAE